MSGIRYAVIVKPPDDHPGFTRVYGTFKDEARATSFADKINEAVDHDADYTGWAYVKIIRKPLVREAKRFVLLGE